MDMHKQKTIMVVDDEPINIDVLYELLKHKHAIIGITSGCEALKILEEGNKPDVILLDICMPDIDGYEVCRRIKESEATKDIPVIFLTAAIQEEEEVCGFSIGAADYIKKPIRPSVVQARIKTQLELRSKQQELEATTKELREAIRVFENKITIPSQIKKLHLPQQAEELEEFDITKIFLDDHIMDMIELESVIDAKINIMCIKGKMGEKDFFVAKDTLHRYGEIFSLYPDFGTVGNGLKNFADRLFMHDDLPQSTIELALASMEVMLFTMLRWREQLFSGELKDIHIYDDSLLADMETILSLLEPKSTVSNNTTDTKESEDVFFF
jgi:CheY-like chemotaxis protein